MLIALFLLLAAAGSLRVPLMDNATFTGLPVREYRAALIARAFYLESSESAPGWRVALAEGNREREGQLEPPIMEWSVAQVWRLLGREALWVPRLLSSLAWLGAGIFLFLFVRLLTDPVGALLATAYLLFLPVGVRTSVSFQPDAWMLCAFLAALWFLLRHHRSASILDLLAAATCSAVALLIKPIVVFMLGAAFASLALQRRRSWRSLVDGSALAYAATALAPCAAYYLYGMFGAGFLGQQASMSFVPGLWLEPAFWRDWLFVGIEVLGAAPIALALVAVPLVEGRTARSLLAALCIGYVVFGLTFTYHIHTHGYYHLQSVPVVGTLLGVSVARLLREISDRRGSKQRWVPVAGAAALLLVFSVRGVRDSIDAARVESPEVSVAIGELVHHNGHVVYVAYGYGNALAYQAELCGCYWSRPPTGDASTPPEGFEDDPRLAALGFAPEYFVVTDLDAYRAHHADLRRYLETRCRLLSDDPRYLVYATNAATPDP